jgi:anti-sigma B factor antagonist
LPGIRDGAVRTFWLEAANAGDSAIITVGGEVDLDTAHRISEMGLALLIEGALPILVLDLEAVTFIDSTGLGALVELHNASRESGQQLRLRRIPERVQSLLRITGLDALFAVDDPPQKAGDEPDVLGSASEL